MKKQAARLIPAQRLNDTLCAVIEALKYPKMTQPDSVF